MTDEEQELKVVQPEEGDPDAVEGQQSQMADEEQESPEPWRRIVIETDGRQVRLGEVQVHSVIELVKIVEMAYQGLTQGGLKLV